MHEEALSLPWWAMLYLCTVYGFSAIGLWEDLRHNRVAAIGGIMSLATITVFIFSYHMPHIASHFGYLFFPMLVLGIVWEFTQAIHETERAQEELEKEMELNDGEKAFLVNMATGLNALLIVPGYAYGIKLCYDIIVGA